MHVRIGFEYPYQAIVAKWGRRIYVESKKRMDKKQKGKGNGIHKNMQVASVVKSGQAQARDRRQSDSTQIAAAASRHQEVTRSRAAASTSHKCAYQLVKENDDAARSKDVNYSTLQSG